MPLQYGVRTKHGCRVRRLPSFASSLAWLAAGVQNEVDKADQGCDGVVKFGFAVDLVAGFSQAFVEKSVKHRFHGDRGDRGIEIPAQAAGLLHVYQMLKVFERALAQAALCGMELGADRGSLGKGKKDCAMVAVDLPD